MEHIKLKLKKNIKLKEKEKLKFDNLKDPIFLQINEYLEDNNVVKYHYDNQTAILWRTEEINLDKKDVEKFYNLSEETQDLIKSILLFFNFSEELVIDSLDDLEKTIPYRSVKDFYKLQSYIETVHDRTYKLAAKIYYKSIEQYIYDSYLMQEIINIGKKNFNFLFNLNDYTCKYLESKTQSEKVIFYAVAEKINLLNKWKNIDLFIHKLVAFFTIELISFNVLFALINLFKNNNDGLKYIVEINMFVSRDENIHANFGIDFYNNFIINKLNEKEIKYIIKDITDTEIKFLETLIKNVKINTFELLDFTNYAKKLANMLLNKLSFTDLYDDILPVKEEFNIQGLKIKNNFFERQSVYIINDKKINTKDIINLFK